jgi:hypothetical protein
METLVGRERGEEVYQRWISFKHISRRKRYSAMSESGQAEKNSIRANAIVAKQEKRE